MVRSNRNSRSIDVDHDLHCDPQASIETSSLYNEVINVTTLKSIQSNNSDPNQPVSEEYTLESQTKVASKSVPSSKIPGRSIKSYLSKLSLSLSSSFQYFFFWYGKSAATYPALFILISVSLSAVCGIGLITFQTEERPFKLWIPQDSDFIKIGEWQKDNFPNEYRYHAVIYEAENVLDKSVLLELLRVHEAVVDAVVYLEEADKPPAQKGSHHWQRNVTWADVCVKLPDLSSNPLFGGRKKRNLKTIYNDVTTEWKLDTASKVDGPLLAKQLSQANSYGYLHRKRNKESQSNILHNNSVHIDIASVLKLNSSKSELRNLNKRTSATLKRTKRQFGIDYLPHGLYCELVARVNMKCYEKSLLEVWGYDRDTLETLTQENIIDDVNTKSLSAVFGFATNFSNYLGGITTDKDGRIIGAKVMVQSWLSKINPDKVIPGKYVDDFGTGLEVDVNSYRWEELFIETLLNKTLRPQGVNLYMMSALSFGKISTATINDDVVYFVLGYTVVFIYVQVMLGKFNAIEARPILSLLGISSVPLSMISSYGIASALGMKYGPMNNILPFLLLGLGIDDMFVIMGSFNNLSPEDRLKSLPERMGYTMKHAGASITVTSATDVIAFAIGSLTILPGLQSFCVFAAFGIAAMFLLQTTYFVAWFSIDQRRVEAKRNAWLCCWVMKNWKTNECSQRDLCQTFFRDIYAKNLVKPVSKAFVLLFTLILFGTSCWGLSNLRQEFNPIWFLPQNSYLYKYFMKQAEYFPSSGATGLIYFGNVSLYEELNNIGKLTEAMTANEYIGKVDSWYDTYKQYYEGRGYQVPDPYMTSEDFQDYLSIFLQSPSGSRYRDKNFRFAYPLKCNEIAPPVTASSIEFTYKKMDETRYKIDAMNSLKDITGSSNITGFVAPYSRVHSGWETDEVIKKELLRNMSLALIVVFLVTFALIASLVQSLLVLSCVLMTLVDVAALMHWWGLTIDTISCVNLVLAIGLCVDYAAHVGHMFMTCQGSRNQRARDTLVLIGPAVLNGGFSTFLALCFLWWSDSHVFVTFFKIFVGVCLFGLYHGLVFLPVVLSLIGPKPYAGVSRWVPPPPDDHQLKTLTDITLPQSSKESDCTQQTGESQYASVPATDVESTTGRVSLVLEDRRSQDQVTGSECGAVSSGHRSPCRASDELKNDTNGIGIGVDVRSELVCDKTDAGAHTVVGYI